MRIKKHPILEFEYGKKIPFYFNLKKMEGYPSDTIASALHANGVKTFTRSLKYDRPRGFFCGIGKCSSCLMRVEGIPNVRTCIAPLKKGVHVELQDKFAKKPSAEFKNKTKEIISADILVAGAGPAGMCASIEAVNQGAKVVLVDENLQMGGQLVKQTHKFFGSKHEKAGTRGIQIAVDLEKELRSQESKGKIKIMLNSTVIGYYEGE